MKKQLFLTVLLTILITRTFSQITFENGYFINESNQKIDCLIKNIDWKNNPTEFEYKLSQNDEIQKADIKAIKEFGINGISKYIKAAVKIDKSNDDLNALTYEKNPVFQNDLLFLKVLIEGNASLYVYEDEFITRFFYKTNDSTINQLVYKRFLVNSSISDKYSAMNSGTSYSQNNYFRGQLYDDLKCQGIDRNKFDIKYTESDLVKLFMTYNKCVNPNFTNFKSEQKKDLFNLTVRPSLNYLTIKTSNDITKIDFGNNLGFKFGVEAEFILPFNKNKWSIIVEPTFQSIKFENETKVDFVVGETLTAKLKHQTIDLPIGLRNYFFFNNNSKVFVNISYILALKKNLEVEYYRANGTFIFSDKFTIINRYGLGVGYKYKDKYSIELRYQTNKKIFGDKLSLNVEYTAFSILLGYSFF